MTGVRGNSKKNGDPPGTRTPNLEIKSTNEDFTAKHQDDLRRTKDKEKGDSEESD